MNITATTQLVLQTIVKIIVGHLNINSIRSKLYTMKLILMHNMYVFMVTETKVIFFQFHNLIL